jgi:hypothetical protein
MRRNRHPAMQTRECGAIARARHCGGDLVAILGRRQKAESIVRDATHQARSESKIKMRYEFSLFAHVRFGKPLCIFSKLRRLHSISLSHHRKLGDATMLRRRTAIEPSH